MITDHDTNIVVLSGEVLSSPKVIELENGKDKLSFSIDLHRRFLAKNNTVKKSQSLIMNIEAFGGLIRWGEAKLKQGDKVLIVGRYQLDTNNVPVITAKSIYIVKDAYIHVEV